MATVDAHGYDSMQALIVSMSQQLAQVLCMRVMIYVYQLRGAGISYRRGGLRLLVLTVWAIPTASVCGASKRYRLHVFFVYVNNLYLTVNWPNQGDYRQEHLLV